MADLTAHFTADFSNFKTAVDQAETKLRSFQTDANKVQASLGRIGDSFSGRKILQEATLATKAVNDMGGATRLTANEQARLNAQVTEAIAKYTALGQQAPADLTKIQKETSKQTSLITDLTQALGPLGTAVAGAFSVGAVINFGREVFRFASDMEDLSAQTGIGVEELQALNFAAAGANLPIEVLGNAILAMSKRVGEGDASAVKGIEKLHLNLETLRASNPHEMFLEIASAAKSVENPISALSDLFGERLARQILKLANDDLPALEKQAQQSGAIIDQDLIKKADEFGDAWSRQIIRVKALFATIFVGGATRNEQFAKEIETLQLSPAELERSIKDQQDAIRKGLSTPLKSIAGGGNDQTTLGIDLKFAAGAEESLNRQIAYKQDLAREAEKQFEIEVKIAEELRKQAEFGASWARFIASNVEQTGGLVALLERGRAALLPTGGTGVAGGPGTPLLPGGEVNKELTAALIQAVPEVKGLAKKTSSAFSDELLDNLGALRHRVPSIITDAFTGGGGLSGALKGIGVQLANAFLEPFIDTIISGLAKGSLKRAFGNAIAGAAGGAAIGGAAAGAGVGASVAGVESSIFGGTAAGAGAGGVGASLAAFATNPITIGVAAAIGGALVLRHFLSGGKQANDIRDQDQAQFGGPGTGSGSGFRRLADMLHRFGDDALFSRFQSANNPGDVRNSFSAIIADLSRHNLNRGIKSYADGGFVAPGVVQPAILHGGRFGERIISGNRQTQGPALNQTSVIINVNAVDAAGFDRVWKERIVPQLKLELLTNQLGTVTAINRVVAKA